MRNPFRRKRKFHEGGYIPPMPELDPAQPWERMNRVPADPVPWRRLREPDPSELADTVTIEKDDQMTIDPADPKPIAEQLDPIRYDTDFYGTAARHEDEKDPQEDSTPLATAAGASQRKHLDGEPDVGYTVDDLMEQLPSDADDRQDCPHCRGTGKVLTVNDLLRESIGLLEGNEDAVIREFYARLLTAAPDLAPLFPRDLLAEDEIDHQRDRLLSAIVALATHYDPDNDAAMATLDTALASYGRAHSAFRRPDGSVRGATIEEYVDVKSTLFGVLHDVAGVAWRNSYDGPWSEAYDYAAIRMLAAQLDAPQRFGRFPRQ